MTGAHYGIIRRGNERRRAFEDECWHEKVKKIDSYELAKRHGFLINAGFYSGRRWLDPVVIDWVYLKSEAKKPGGLYAFLADRVVKKRPGSSIILFFMKKSRCFREIICEEVERKRLHAAQSAFDHRLEAERVYQCVKHLEGKLHSTYTLTKEKVQAKKDAADAKIATEDLPRGDNFQDHKRFLNSPALQYVSGKRRWLKSDKVRLQMDSYDKFFRQEEHSDPESCKAAPFTESSDETWKKELNIDGCRKVMKIGCKNIKIQFHIINRHIEESKDWAADERRYFTFLEKLNNLS